MKALVLCAGEGTRLGELCRDTPKPLLQVGGRTIVEHIVERLAHAGCTDVWINLRHMGEQIPPVLGDGARFGVAIHYVWESKARGTAGTVADLRDLVGDELLVHYGDIVTDHGLADLVGAHRKSGAWATMLVHERAGSNSVAVLGDDGRVLAFHERPRAPVDLLGRTPYVFSGLCVLTAAAMAAIPTGLPADLPADVFPLLARTGRLHAQRLAGARVAVDSPERLALARSTFAADVTP
ncbi:MAG TPA: nucleotidyltransferase family protein [Nannocystaceae bacterium]|nr:nucleotidyltransferase family protein [Nannocystaceae bacterium]